MRKILVVAVLLAVMLGLAGWAWSHGEKATEAPAQSPSSAPEASAQATGAEPSPPGPSLSMPAQGPGEAEEPAWEETVHLVGKVGLVGLLVAGAVGLIILFSRPAGPARMKWRRTHVFIAVPLALLAMTHGTTFFILHLVEGKYGEVFASGSWLCTSVFFLFVTGLLRYLGKGRLETLRIYHRVFQVAFLLAFIWHVVPKLT